MYAFAIICCEMLYPLIDMDYDRHLLPFWLEFHRDIFEGCALMVSQENESLICTIRKYCPNWKIVGKDILLENGNIAYTYIRPCDYLFFAEPRPDIHSLADAFADVLIWQACLHNMNRTPNNIIDLLSNVKGVILSSPRGESPYTIGKLSFEYSTNNQINQTPTNNTPNEMMRWIGERLSSLKNTDYIYYLEPYADCEWGEDRVLLKSDINLLGDTDFNEAGYKVFPIGSVSPILSSAKSEKRTWREYFNQLLCRSSYSVALENAIDLMATSNVSWSLFWKGFVEKQILEITSRQISAEKYHETVTEEEHKQIINAMPYKKTSAPELLEFAECMESRVSEIVGKKVKVFNDDLWVRICRPDSVSTNDYNPCHRDVYLDFYRNIVNIYVPIVGSNELSSLAMEPGSHWWNERDLMVTKGGAEFKSSGKKYSVDAIVQSRQRLNMLRPNPAENEFILFSPYLIHGCSSNENLDVTRMSVEVRFIEDTEAGRAQELAFNEFLKSRVWR